MKRKKAIITVLLVDESIEESDEKIRQELIECFEEGAICIPWIKNLKDIIIEDC